MKLGGEELTRQRIKLEKVEFAEKPELFKRRIPIVPKEPLAAVPEAEEKTAANDPAPTTDETTAKTESNPVTEETKVKPEPAKK